MFCLLSTETTHGIPLQEQGEGQAFNEHGQMVGDMNKSHKTDPP